MRLTRTLAALGACVTILGCDFLTEPRVCMLGASPSIAVLAVDSVSGDTLWSGTTLIQSGDGFIDSVTAPEGAPPNGYARLSVSGAYERPGLYTVTVRRAEYLEWQRPNVRVRNATCGVNTVELTARLVPE